ncbi:glycoside hydrolase family 31 protein [Marivirga sp. S37H4]|uniref:Glycoside hydrolase family 31 protein n=1 Tax=Marivirga aurantiaca TaxID=2802615 RepID=A0A934WVQ8_9BACT|nr:glycoside hydrolase family 31 protein [Marivirga aurantiaca]MBK6263805.1 glycoside hydrolase family 31 protein [Marivirga aurantiaca]
MEEEKNIAQEKDVNFEGNYIEKFKEGKEEEFYPGGIISWKQKKHKVKVYSEFSTLEINIISDSILKFRYANDGYFEDDFSYAIDPEFEAPETPFTFKSGDKNLLISTSKLLCFVNKKDSKIKICDLSGKVLMEDEKGYHWKEERRFGGHVVISTIKSSKTSSYYGLGDKTGALNLNGTRRELWGTDCYGYGNETDPVYKNIPFFLGLNEGEGYGIFMDNSFRSYFDFGNEREEALSFWAQGGEMRYYFIYGPQLEDVTIQYTELTGKSPMPPKWALGYHQSKWSYYPESTVRELAKTFREKKIPCDVIHLDIDYMDGYRCFTWDSERFPEPHKMIADLKKDGFKTIVIIDPGIKIDPLYSLYQQGVYHNYFCTRMDGARFKGSVWPGPCHFPDFTNPEARKWWSGLFAGLAQDGVAGVWNDMNEPAVFEGGTFPRDVRHDYDGHPCSHRKGHNVYGMQMARSTYNGLEQFAGNKRSFTITRSAYSGIQRFSSVWTGDNMASWEHLHLANVQCQRLSSSGISFAGSDVGGFIGSPDGELYTRWIQLATFHPFFRTHSSGDHGDKEPWKFEDNYLNIVRRYIEFRYELMPYLYTTFWQYAESGIPMLKSLSLAYQHDKETLNREEEFLLGNLMLICPVSKPGMSSRLLYLPEGEWYNFWTNELLSGQQEISVETPLEQIPLFIKAGAVIPFQPTMQYMDEFVPEYLTLYVYKASKRTESFLYEDDGATKDFEKGINILRTFIQEPTGNRFQLKQIKDGLYEAGNKGYEIVLHGFGESIQNIVVDDKKVEWNSESNITKFTVAKNFDVLEITIT